MGQILTSTDQKLLHWLEVGKLTPETQYYFAVMAGNTVAHGSLQTARVGAGVPYTLYGQLMSSGQNPVPTALVAVSAINNSGTSSFLAAISNNDGFWNVNLGNLKVPASGTIFGHNIGDQLSIQVSRPPDTSFYDQQQAVTGESPQRITLPVLVLDDVIPHSVGLIDISLTGVVTLNISAGWNMIALPGLPTNLDSQSLGLDGQTLLQPFYYWKPDSFSYKPVTQLDFVKAIGFYRLILMKKQLPCLLS